MIAKYRSLALVSTAVFLTSLTAQAGEPERDPARARALLVQGYELAQAGKCTEAIPLFRQSLELDANVKILLNLARCEEAASKLVDALVHWTQARGLASELGQTAVVTEADARRASLERRVPRLSVDMLTGAPKDARVLVDGAEVPRDAIARGVSYDIGAHTVVVSAPGRVDESVTIELRAGDAKTVVVRAGVPIPEAPEASAPPAVALPAPFGGAEADPRRGGAWRAAGLVTGGAGVVAIGVGAYFGIRAIAKNGDSNGGCDGNTCTPEAAVLRNDARAAGDTATVFFIAGAALAVGGGLMYALAPSAKKGQNGRTIVMPAVGPSFAGVSVTGVAW